MTTDTADQGNFAEGPLYKALVEWLPTFVRDPFASTGAPSLKIADLHRVVGKSHEAVYKWLRLNRLTTKNARKLLDLANSADNVAALKHLGRTPPTIRDFDQFTYFED